MLLALLVLVAPAWPGQSRDYRTDLRLAKPITLRLKIVPLSACVKALADATGVGINVATNIKDRKVTLIFKDRPASEAMTMLASTMFCGWSAEQGSYRLEMSQDSKNEERRMLQAEEAVLKERLSAAVANMIEVAASPKDVLLEQRDRMSETMKRLRASTKVDDRRQYDQFRKEYDLQFGWLPWWDTGYELRHASGIIETLIAGSTIFGCTTPGVALPLPIGSIPTFTARVVVPGPDGKMVMETRTPTGAVAALRLNSVTGQLQQRVMATGVLPAGGATSHEASLLESDDAETKLSNEPLRKRLYEWAQLLDTDVLARKLTPGAPAPGPGYAAKAYTIAEHLERLSDSAGIPIAADAFRLAASTEAFFGSATVGAYVDELRNEVRSDVRTGYFRSERGWLLFKHPRYWRQLDAEIPESALVPIEEKFKAGYQLTVSDYAAFASTLTRWQALNFPTRGDLTRFPRKPLMEAMAALRLWGSLNQDQRQTAYVSGLPVESLDGTQRELFREAVNDLLWLGHVNETFFPVLMGRAGASYSMGLFMQDARNGAEPIFGDYDEDLEPPRSRTFASGDMERLRQRSYVFSFGDSPKSGASYSIVLAPRGGEASK